MVPRDPKRCTQCGETKSRTEFYARPTKRSPKCVTAECKECAKAQQRSRKGCKKRAKYIRRSRLLRDYGLTVEQYDALLEAQGGCCAVCRTDTPKGRGRFHVDHCHATGIVRGLLCHPCNVGIGNLGDDPEKLRKAAKYLERRGK